MTDDNQGPSAADQVGEAAGGITGAFAGAAIGATAGPVGVLLGGIAGAIGGWWSGRALSEAAEDITSADEEYYRADFERSAERRLRDRRLAFDRARSAYILGDVAAANPDYKSFEDVERDLAHGWRERAAAHGDWEAVRGYASVGFARGKDRRRKPR
jgi:hypothetical protein